MTEPAAAPSVGAAAVPPGAARDRDDGRAWRRRDVVRGRALPQHERGARHRDEERRARDGDASGRSARHARRRARRQRAQPRRRRRDATEDIAGAALQRVEERRDRLEDAGPPVSWGGRGAAPAEGLGRGSVDGVTQGARELEHAREALLGIDGERLPDRRVDGGAHTGREVGDRRGLGLRAFLVKGRDARQHLVGDGRQRVLVALRVVAVVVRAGLRRLLLGRAVARRRRGPRARERRRHPKAGHLHPLAHRAGRVDDEHLVGPQLEVHDALLVGRGDGPGRALDERRDALDGHEARLGDDLGEARAVDPLEHEEGRHARLAIEVEDLHDAGVAERHGDLGAAPERLPRRRGRPQLDRETAGETLVTRFEHLTRSLGDGANQPVLAAEDVSRQLRGLSHVGHATTSADAGYRQVGARPWGRARRPRRGHGPRSPRRQRVAS